MGADDPLAQALEAVKGPGEYIRLYGGVNKMHNQMVVEPLVQAIRLLVGEVGSLRDEIAEIRGS